MKKSVIFKLSIKKDFSSDLVEELRHIDKYFSYHINANVEIIVTELDKDNTSDFIVELNGKLIKNPSISKVVDMANKYSVAN